jgi:hypothetical protein
MVLACSGPVYNYITRSPIHRDDQPAQQPPKEMTMTTQLSTKLAALAVALMVNGMMIGGVAYLFSARLHQPTAANGTVTTASARSIVPTI